jgi:hypothetical protein
MSSYLLVASLLFFATAGSLGAKQPPKTTQSNSSSPASASLDYEFFKSKVQPIFLAQRSGHARCVACHAGPAGPAVFRLQALSPGESSWNEEESRKNFEAVKRLVSPGDVQKSPLLTHPLAEDAGGDFFHSGGKHFNSQNDPEWLVLKAFVSGEKAN